MCFQSWDRIGLFGGSSLDRCLQKKKGSIRLFVEGSNHPPVEVLGFMKDLSDAFFLGLKPLLILEVTMVGE